MSNTRIADKPLTTVAEVDHKRAKICVINSVLKVTDALMQPFSFFRFCCIFLLPRHDPSITRFLVAFVPGAQVYWCIKWFKYIHLSFQSKNSFVHPERRLVSLKLIDAYISVAVSSVLSIEIFYISATFFTFPGPNRHK